MQLWMGVYGRIMMPASSFFSFSLSFALREEQREEQSEPEGAALDCS